MFVLELLEMKTQHHASDAIVNSMLKFIHRRFGGFLPDDLRQSLPSSLRSALKLVKELLASVVNIHCCIRQCVAFIGDNKSLTRCPVCGEDRYDSEAKPRFIFRHVPLIPRLKKLYGSEVS
jgi:hypothetical protein